MTTLQEHELIVIGACLNSNFSSLRTLKTLGYVFSTEEYEKISNYLFTEGLKGNINRTDFKDQFKLEQEQIEYFVYQGLQNAEASEKYLVKQKTIYDRQGILKHVLRGGVDNLGHKELEDLEMRLRSVKPLREFKSQNDIDLTIGSYVSRLQSGELKLLQTPFPSWNDNVNGISQEDLVVVGAYSGSGKTHFAIQTALSVLENKARVCMISGENSEEEIKIRFGTHKAKVFETSINTIGSKQSTKLIDSIMTLTAEHGDNLTLIREIDFDEIFNIINARAAADMDDFYILDYIQLFSSKKKYGSERERLADYCQQLVDFIGRYKKPVMILSQLVKGETDSFKGAQDILNMATIGAFITKGYELEDDPEYGKHKKVIVEVKKVRRGTPFKIYGVINEPDPAIKEIKGLTNLETEPWTSLIKPNYR